MAMSNMKGIPLPEETVNVSTASSEYKHIAIIAVSWRGGGGGAVAT